jgi:hypothetical protein
MARAIVVGSSVSTPGSPQVSDPVAAASPANRLISLGGMTCSSLASARIEPKYVDVMERLADFDSFPRA